MVVTYVVEWECGGVGALVDKPLHPNLALLLLPERSRGQDLPHHPGTLGAREEILGVIASQKPRRKGDEIIPEKCFILFRDKNKMILFYTFFKGCQFAMGKKSVELRKKSQS